MKTYRAKLADNIKVIIAFTERKPIEVANRNSEPLFWNAFDGEYPDFTNENWVWRVKAESPTSTPTLRPWRPEEVPVGALLRGHIKTDTHSKECLITGRFGAWVYFDGGEKTVNYLLNNQMEHSLDHGKTWLPCGVTE